MDLDNRIKSTIKYNKNKLVTIICVCNSINRIFEEHTWPSDCHKMVI